MKTIARIAMALAGMAGLVASAAAENRGLPIITDKPDMVFDGGCLVAQPVNNSIEPGVGEPGDYFPAQDISWYFSNVQHVEIDISKAVISVVKGPQHGSLVQMSLADTKKLADAPLSGPMYRYRTNPGYLGPDDATLLIEIGGKNYKVHTKFYVVEKVNDNNFYGQGTPATLCAESQPKRIASLTFDRDINLAQWGDIIQEITTSTSGFRFNQYISAASGVTLNFADFPGSAVGQTVGSNITLDTAAAGHGWYVDANPWDNSEYLATSNPYECVAKE